MGVADRLYETACECRDLETRLDAVLRELDRQRVRADQAEETLKAFSRAAGELWSEVEDALLVNPSFPAGVARRAEELRALAT